MFFCGVHVWCVYGYQTGIDRIIIGKKVCNDVLIYGPFYKLDQKVYSRVDQPVKTVWRTG